MSTAPAEAEISITFRTPSDAEALNRALGPEIHTAKKSRASVQVTRRARLLTLRFSATDLVALRAMVNSFLRLAATWKRVSVAFDAKD